MADRAQKVLAAAGYGSRREIERLIAAGQLVINGEVAKLGATLEGNETIVLSGKPVSIKASRVARHRHLIYHKPVGEVCSRSDPEGRKLVFDAIPEPGLRRWITVGRLDIATSGLLLMTTDGELANRLMHPSYEVTRDYAVRIMGDPPEEILEQLRSGITLEDGEARFASLTRSGGQGLNRWFNVQLAEGRNREVRRIWEAAGFTVSRLVRTAYGPISLPANLPRGKYRELEYREISALYKSVKLSAPDAPSRAGGNRRQQRRSKYRSKGSR
ncbi:MAG: 23S rRNA pseudouridine(2605) synthase RluB [Pseudomonadota bacterium]